MTSQTRPRSTPQLDALFASTARRLGLLRAVRGATMALLLSALWLLRGCIVQDAGSNAWPTMAHITLFVGAAIIGAILGWWRSLPEQRAVAATLERLVPTSRNLFVTAAELSRDELSRNELAGTTPPVAEFVRRRANDLAGTVHVDAMFPIRHRLIALTGSVVLGALAVMLIHGVQREAFITPRAAIASITGRVDITRIAVRVTPPRYTKRNATTARDPARIDALIGSSITLTVDANADSLVVTTRDNARAIARGDATAFTISLPAMHDGFVSLEPRSRDGRVGVRRLIGLSVRSDESPRVRIAQPARDMIFPDANHTLDVHIEADDDLGLAALTLRYTKVSGAGERFTFTEGEIPITITRASGERWTARAKLALEPLLTEAGDLVVYRAIATDARPGSPPVESDAYIAELTAPGGIAAAGFSVDPDENRYALSQQMVILKTERLIATRAAKPTANVTDDAAQLAIEQRRVRAEFVFMMGGEFAQGSAGDDVTGELDETAEAEAEGDLAAGRMANRGRVSLLAAVRNMSRAAGALTTADLTAALAREKVALKQLQDAFARQRFLMRALSQREQLDLTRRQTGKLDSIARAVQPIPEGERDAHRLALRAVLRDVFAAGATVPGDASELTALAERVLQIDPSAKTAQRVAAQLSAASAALGDAGKVRAVTAQLDSAAIGLTGMMRESLRPAASAPLPRELRELQSHLQSHLQSQTQSRGNP